MISREELPKREGVELLDWAGVDGSWPMPVAIWDAPKGFNTCTRPDHQPCHVIAVRLSGALVERVRPDAFKSERLRPRGFSVHPAGRELRFVASSAIRFAHLYVSQAFLQDIYGKTTTSGSPDAALVRSDRVMYLDAEMSSQLDAYVHRAFQRSDPPSKLEMESRANLIALRLLRYKSMEPLSSSQSESNLAPWQLRRVCNHLEANLDRTVRLTELAELIGISKEHLCRAFHLTTGRPPLRWHLEKRIERACELLARNQSTLTSIAQDVGYSGQSSFGTAFKELMGMTPDQYRRLRQN
ncbi:AraC family transcriptional regulator [Rhizobium sp. WYJ-E13]|uniref:AraC family transcriptional regulator n=1 Tax=Rhizobium sp. WYJ-E13 TaxID=2849093 RepID=UPI001C1ED13B|nr:AraC family transcriptional regulator [Rhizobium sp. WYJ-E13]QWW71332.1 AraC family transcriptional regulator [Rhizobium sp. WYJ-E13]